MIGCGKGLDHLDPITAAAAIFVLLVVLGNGSSVSRKLGPIEIV